MIYIYIFYIIFKKSFMAFFHRWGSIASSPEPLRVSLVFTAKFPEFLGLILVTSER